MARDSAPNCTLRACGRVSARVSVNTWAEKLKEGGELARGKPRAIYARGGARRTHPERIEAREDPLQENTRARAQERLGEQREHRRGVRDRCHARCADGPRAGLRAVRVVKIDVGGGLTAEVRRDRRQVAGSGIVEVLGVLPHQPAARR